MQRIIQTGSNSHKAIAFSHKNPANLAIRKYSDLTSASPASTQSRNSDSSLNANITFGSPNHFNNESPKSVPLKEQNRVLCVKPVCTPKPSIPENFSEYMNKQEKILNDQCDICSFSSTDEKYLEYRECLHRTCAKCYISCSTCLSKVCKKCYVECLECALQICIIGCSQKCARCKKSVCKKCLETKFIKPKEAFICVKCIEGIMKENKDEEWKLEYTIDNRPAMVKNEKDGKCFSIKGKYIGKFAGKL